MRIAMNNEWFSAAQLAGLPGLPKNERNIRMLAERNDWQSRKRATGKGLEYHLSSLPEETQRALRQAQGKPTRQAQDAQGPLTSVSETAPALTPSHTSVSEAAKVIAAGQRVITTQLTPNSPAKLRRQVLAVAQVLARETGWGKEDWLRRVADEMGVSVNTLRAWVDKHSSVEGATSKAVPSGEAGPAGFSFIEEQGGTTLRLRVTLDGRGIIDRTHVTTAFSGEFIGQVLGKVAKSRTHRTLKAIYNEVKGAAADKGWVYGSYQSCDRIIKALLDSGGLNLRDVWRRGDKWVRETLAPYVSRDRKFYRPLQVIVGDQKVLDYKVEWLDENGVIHETAPTAFFWVDIRTDCIVGWSLVAGPYNWVLVAEALADYLLLPRKELKVNKGVIKFKPAGLE